MSTRTRHAVTNTLPALLPDCLPGATASGPLRLPPLSEDTARQVSDRLLATDFDAWSEALARVGNCAHPIRLSGHSATVDLATGEIVASYTSSSERLGVTHVRCGNRRASECLSCSRVYAGNMFEDTLESKRSRTVPLVADLVPIIDKWSEGKASGSWLFPAPRGGPLSEPNGKRSVGWSAAVRKIGRPTLRVHDLRHTCVTLARCWG